MSQPDPGTQPIPPIEKASLKALPDGEPVYVHFNPTSLVYTLQNSNQQQGGDPNRRQHNASFSAKLTMDLQFDTTATGEDVRQYTNKVAQFMKSSADANKPPQKGKGTNKPAPPVLSFDWGVYHFQGFMESLKETIDFFSAKGVPMRALVSIGLAQQDAVFDPGAADKPTTNSSLVPTPERGSVADLTGQGGDPNATRALAAANGVENPRFTGGAPLQVNSGIQLNPAIAFVASASAGVGIGVSGGLGLGLSAGAGVGFSAGASANAGFGAGASFSAGASSGIGVSVAGSAGGQVTLAAGGGALFGSAASAGVPATAGAFAGLEAGRATFSTTAQLDPLRMLPSTVGSDVSVGANASFGLGGVAVASSGFSADVGANASFSDRLTFDGE